MSNQPNPFSFNLVTQYTSCHLETLYDLPCYTEQRKHYNIKFSLCSSPAPTGPPQSFTVTPGARNMTFSWSPPSPTLRNGVITGYFLSCVPEAGGGRNTISMQYIAPGTFTLGGFTPDTSYNCSIFANNSQGHGPATYLISTTLEACK